MDYYVAISFIISHMGYNKCIKKKKQAYLLQGSISLGKKFWVKDGKLFILYTYNPN